MFEIKNKNYNQKRTDDKKKNEISKTVWYHVGSKLREI